MPKARTGSIFTCPECGKEEYMSPRESQRRRYCSQACRDIATTRDRQRVCQFCGKQFEMIGDVWGKYCSNTCYQASRQKRTDCAVCGKVLTGHQATYCSHACRDEGRRTLEERPCAQCGNPMRVQPHQFETKRFCSRACKNKSLELQGPGARIKRVDGYIQVYYPKHPDAARTGFVLEHRLVAEEKYGRRILKSEHVHHLNGVRDDNRPENVEIIDPGAHALISNAHGKAKRASMRARLAEYERRFGPI